MKAAYLKNIFLGLILFSALQTNAQELLPQPYFQSVRTVFDEFEMNK